MSLLPTTPEIVLIASPDGPVTAYDPYTGTVIARFSGSRCPRNGITVISNNQFACTHVSDTGVSSVHLYNWWSMSCVQSIPLPEHVAPLVATTNGSYLFSGGVSDHIHSVSVPSGSDDGTIAVIPTLMLLDVSPDTKFGCSSFRRKDLKVQTRKQVASGREAWVWGRKHDGAVVSMDMLNHGQTLFTVSENGQIHVWETVGGKIVTSFSEKIRGVSGVVMVRERGSFGTREIESEECGSDSSEAKVGKVVTVEAEMEEALKVVAEDRGE
uniref:Protein root initiation defective 3-like n=1 Tax=Tanacetum cinerariifolium TaxID=118510 RepID=A0A6L2JHE6_TANCI|nr:protein root initiation defective 3-like [Tanacetum cinerariifolium]